MVRRINGARLCPAVRGDPFGRLSRVGRRDDRPADDEIAGARGERLGRGHRPALVASFVVGRRGCRA